MDEPSPESERRRSRRYRVRVRVLYFSKGQPRGVDAACDNIGIDGVFIRTRRTGPEVGTLVSLLLTFDGPPGEIMVDGVVRRQTVVKSPEDGAEQVGMGIQFVELAPELRETLARAIADAAVPGQGSAGISVEPG